MRKLFRSLSLLLFLTFSMLGYAKAMFMMPSLIPTDRMLKNTRAFLAKNPESAEAHFTVARIHYLTFANRVWLVQAWDTRDQKKPPRVAPDFLISYGGNIVERAQRAEAEKRVSEKIDRREDGQIFYEAVNKEVEKLKAEGWKPDALSKAETLEQATLALQAFEKAIELDPGNPLYLLGKASLEQQTVDFLAENPDLASDDSPFKKLSPETLLASYYRAYAAGRDEDLERKHLPISGLKSMVTYESGTAILQLHESHPEAAGQIKGLKVAQVKKDLDKLKKLQMGAITPIILSEASEIPLSDLIRNSPVHFDVDGDGRKEKLDSWPNEKAALLVWDPGESGKVTSGRQWFGTFGFQMLWRDGYQAMDALDDSRDGWLSGDELRGLALWRDANGNAISDPGEVRSVDRCGISAIAVTPDSPDSLHNLKGVYRIDGSVTASHDWIFQLLE